MDPNAQTLTASADKSAELKKALVDFADKTFRDFSRYRFAEEREWYEAALFYQRRQWLSWNDQARRFDLMKPDKKRPRPMPVSNYFATTLDAAANQLASNMPRVLAQAQSDDDRDRRGADYAEDAIPAIDKESGMRVLNPLLAKHVVLWGIAVTKDVWDASLSTGQIEVPRYILKKTKVIGCVDCGETSEVGDSGAPSALFAKTTPEPAAPDDGERDDAQASDQAPEPAAPDPEPQCPKCGSRTVARYERQDAVLDQVMAFSRGKIVTEVRPIFEIFLPRDCQNPNLAKRICQRYRKPLGELRRMFPQAAQNIKADEKPEVAEIYLQALRSLVNYNFAEQQTQECATCTEVWCDWDELPEKVQKAIADEDAGRLQDWQRLGGYMITAGGELLDSGPSPLNGKKPFTFFLWNADPANVYPKGLAADLIPLQKRLNRIDSLIELAMMTNSVGKWMWPTTQTTEPPSGSPNELVRWDPIGDGKIAPTFVQPSPFHSSVWQLRQTILQDFQQIGLTGGVSSGRASSNSAFRALAYLGAKQDEQINTQRFLWEAAHLLRYEKCLTMARKWWDEPRKVRVAGPNGGYLVRQFTREDLQGDYDLDFVPGSSRPRSLDEKQAALAALLQAGLVDITDIETRDYILDMANLNELNLADHRQYLKAQRDLEVARQGGMPLEVPFIKWDVHLKVFANFTLTEEFEALSPEIQQHIVQLGESYANRLNTIKQQMAPAPGGPGGPSPAQTLGAAMSQQAPQNPLEGVPGATVSPQQVQQAALEQGNEVANQVA